MDEQRHAGVAKDGAGCRRGAAVDALNGASCCTSPRFWRRQQVTAAIEVYNRGSIVRQHPAITQRIGTEKR
jgi:hypothetical protein